MEKKPQKKKKKQACSCSILISSGSLEHRTNKEKQNTNGPFSTLRSPGSLEARASENSAMAWLRYITVGCWSRLIWLITGSTTSGWQCPQFTTAIPAKASKYLLPLSSNRYCIFPSTMFSWIKIKFKLIRFSNPPHHEILGINVFVFILINNSFLQFMATNYCILFYFIFVHKVYINSLKFVCAFFQMNVSFSYSWDLSHQTWQTFYSAMHEKTGHGQCYG